MAKLELLVVGIQPDTSCPLLMGRIV